MTFLVGNYVIPELRYTGSIMRLWLVMQMSAAMCILHHLAGREVVAFFQARAAAWAYIEPEPMALPSLRQAPEHVAGTGNDDCPYHTTIIASELAHTVFAPLLASAR
jgi:hypothetical protein